jgi:hypothetical protein
MIMSRPLLHVVCFLLVFFVLNKSVSSFEQPGFLVMLECAESIHEDVLFNMQTRRMEELLYLALATKRSLVEPFYHYGARNWTWFEQHPHASDISPGVLGILQEPLTDYFRPAPLEALLGSPMLQFSSFLKASSAMLDLLVRFLPAHRADMCGSGPVETRAFGHRVRARRVVCVDPRSGGALRTAVELAGQGGGWVGLEFMPAKLVELRVAGWRAGEERRKVGDEE